MTEVSLAGVIANKREQVAGAFFDNYTDLFQQQDKQHPIPAESTEHLPKVSPVIRGLINVPISTEDYLRTIKKLPQSKAPGPNGIISEFYQAFSEQLIPILAAVFDDIWTRKLLSPSMHCNNLVLIPKNLHRTPSPTWRITV